jgi:hypothetical protein
MINGLFSPKTECEPSFQNNAFMIKSQDDSLDPSLDQT